MSNEIIRVLLVEDDEDDFVMTRDILNDIDGAHYELQWIDTYQEALATMAGAEHDICLLDYRLGEHTGLELLEEMYGRGYRNPVIFMTGQADRETDLKAMEAGAADYLLKGSIDSRTLERSIRYAIAQKKAEQQILFMAYYDNLTRLPNRVLFQDRLRQALDHAVRFHRLVAVMFLDLDHFKRINDTLGHSAGDLLLQQVSERLSICLRKCDTVGRNLTLDQTVARLGGDEFTILLTEIAHVEDASKVAERILYSLSQSFVLDGHEIFISASIGIAISPSDGTDMETLLKNADSAMYQAKGQGRNNFQHYSSALNAKAYQRLTMENKMHQALERQELYLLYQPQVNACTGKIIGVEALLRWNSPEFGMVSPAEFVPIAEENGLIFSIGDWVLRTACRQNRAWQLEGLAPIRMCVNLSRHQFRKKDFAQSVYCALEDSGLDPRYLELEITESLVMENVKDVAATLEEFRQKGIRVSLDDFGTGFSSLSMLTNFAIQAIKIDREFIKHISNSKNVAIVEAIIAMAKSLKFSLIAEGVETKQQLAFLSERGCFEIQGFLFSKPVPAQQVCKLLEAEKSGSGNWSEICSPITGLRSGDPAEAPASNNALKLSDKLRLSSK